MAATMWPAAGGGSAEAFADSGDEEEFPPYCEQPPPSQMPGYGGFLQSQFQQDGGSPAAGDDHAGPGLSQLPAGGGSHEEQGSEGEDGEEDAGVSQEGGSGLEAAAQRAQRGTSPGERRGEHSTGLTPGLTQLPAWAFGRPASPAPLGSLLAGRECLAVLPDTPAQLTFSVHALLNVRGDPATRPPLPDGQLPPDQDSSQFTGIIDDLFQSQPPPQVPTDMLFSMAADAGEGYYLFRSAAQAQVDKLWALAQQLAGRLADATAALEQQRAEEQERAGLPAPEAEAVVELRDALLEVKQQLEAARAEKEQLLTATQGKLQQASDAAAQREAELQQQLEQASEAAAEREAELQQQLQQACEAAAEREAELQQQLQQACKAAAEQEAKLRQQLQQASEAAAEREAELQQQLQQACKEAAEQETKQQQLEQASEAAAEREAELLQQLQQAREAAAEQEAKLRQLQQAREAAAEREAELQQQLKQAGKAAAAREAELQQQLKHAGKAAAEREAELLQQLEQACEEAAEREAELQQELQHAQQQAEGEGAECRQLRQQLADLQRTRQQELAEADEQQEAAAAEQQRLRNEARRWEARCQAVQQQAAAAGGEQMAAERDAAVTKCRQLQQELAVALRRAADLQEQNAGLQAASAAVLAQVEEVAATAEAHAQEAQAAACVGCMPSSAVPTPEPQVAWRQLSRGEEQELKLLLTDTNYQHAKLGAAFRPLQALRSPKFWQGAAERLQAPEELVQQEGARLLAEVAMAGQRTVEAALREARRSQRTALRQARRMKAVVEGVRREAAERQAAAEQGAGGAARCGKRKQEPQGGYDLWELLVDLSQLEEELLEAQNELDQEREASSCKAWQLLEEEAAQRDAACQRVRQLEAQLEESWELVHQLREQAQLWCLEAQPAAKRARCTAAEPAGGLVLAASDGWEGPPADSEAGEGATWRTAQKQAAEQRHLADQAPESLANTTSQLQPAARSVGQKAEPAAAAAQLHHDGQPDSASMPAGGSEWAPAAASSSTHIQPLLQQGQPAGWQDFMTPQLIAEHRAFAPLMAQALFNDFVKSQQGSRGGARPNGGSKKRRRKAAVP